MSGLAEDMERLAEIGEQILAGRRIEEFDLGEYEIFVVLGYTNERLQKQRDELAEYLHAYLLDNEPQVTPGGLADAVMHWLYTMEAKYRA